MGQLLTVDMMNQGLGVIWYTGCDKFIVPNDNFPHVIHIHEDDIKGHHYSIRKNIEALNGLVVMTMLDLRYFYNWGRKYSDGGFQVEHKYHQFSFEDEASAVAFKLMFSNIITAEPMLYRDDFIPEHTERHLIDGEIVSVTSNENVTVAKENERAAAIYQYRHY